MQEFVIPSMSCGGCASRITQTIKTLDPDATIEVDLPNKTVRVGSSHERDAFAGALETAGYPPVAVRTEASLAPTRATAPRSGCCCG